MGARHSNYTQESKPSTLTKMRTLAIFCLLAAAATASPFLNFEDIKKRWEEARNNFNVQERVDELSAKIPEIDALINELVDSKAAAAKELLELAKQRGNEIRESEAIQNVLDEIRAVEEKIRGFRENAIERATRIATELKNKAGARIAQIKDINVREEVAEILKNAARRIEELKNLAKEAIKNGAPKQETLDNLSNEISDIVDNVNVKLEAVRTDRIRKAIEGLFQ